MAKKEQLVPKKDFILELSKYTPQEINEIIISKGKIKKHAAFILTKPTNLGDNN